MKIAVITGASSGMGRELALQLNDYIDNIEEFWLIGRREERLEALERLLTKPARCLAWDLQSPAALGAYCRLLEECKPEIVFLVNAAGYGMIGEVSTLSAEEQCGMVDLNIRALTEMTRASLPYMAVHSRIIQFASAAAFLPQPDFAVYAASKSYVLSFSAALGEELRGSGCYVTAVCPGPVKTEFFDLAERKQSVPLYKRMFMADARKVAHLALIDSVLGKERSVYGISMKLFGLLSRLLPQKIFFAAIRRINAL